jgi:nicotinamidase-related amidase
MEHLAEPLGFKGSLSIDRSIEMKSEAAMLNIPGVVILDLNTQRDLFAPEGAMPVCHPGKFADTLKRLFSAAQRLHTPVISTRLYNQMVTQPRGGVSKMVCNVTTPGFQKMPSTQLRRRVEMPADCGTSFPVDGFARVNQYIFDLPSLNLFECPRLDRILSESTVQEFVLIGGPLEWTIRTAVLGLLQRRMKVSLIAECIGQWDLYEGDMALRQIESKNVEWLTVEQAIVRMSAKPPRPKLFETRPPAPAAHAAEEPHEGDAPHNGHSHAPARSASRRGKTRGKSPAGKFRA